MVTIHLAIIDATDCCVIFHKFDAIKNGSDDYTEEVEETLTLLETKDGFPLSTNSIERVASIDEPLEIRQI